MWKFCRSSLINRCFIQNILHVVKDPCLAFLTFHLKMSSVVSPFLLTVVFGNIYKGRYEGNASYFFVETVITVIMKFMYIVGTSFTEFSLFFHNVSFVMNILFASLHEMPYVLSPKTHCWSVGALYTCCVSSRLQSSVVRLHRTGAQKYGRQIVLNGDCRENSLPHCCNADWCVVWHCLAGGGFGSSCC
jgi:hypothetical protein